MSFLPIQFAGVVAGGSTFPDYFSSFRAECIRKDATLFGVNHFFRNQLFDLPVSHAVVAAGQLGVFQELVGAVQSGGFPLRQLFSASQGPELELMDLIPDVEVHNLWNILARSKTQGEYFLRGSQAFGHLPTTGLQAVHLLMHLGVEEIHVVGFDFYSGNTPYSYASTRTSGYELGKHDFQTDLSYLIGLMEFYGARLVAHGGNRVPRWLSVKELCVSLGLGHKLELT